MKPPTEPITPRDIIGRTLAPNDYVAYPVSVGSSNGITVGQIVEFKFKRPAPGQESFHYPDLIECPQDQAWTYKARVKPLRTTAGYYDVDDWDGVRPVTVSKVENLVLIDTEHVEDELLAKRRARRQAV